MVCCAWNLNIFNNETLFYEAKKQQKCHDILRMSHCILWCHFHCIWWMNKWWQKMLMRFSDVAFVPQKKKPSSEQNEAETGTFSAEEDRTEKAPRISHLQRKHKLVWGVWNLRVILNSPERGESSDPAVELLNSFVLTRTAESIKPQRHGEPRLAIWSSIKVLLLWSSSHTGACMIT